MSFRPEHVIAETRAWVNRAVIGLNLCPFAKAVETANQIRYVTTEAPDADALLAVLESELQLLASTDPNQTETTLLIHPLALTDFEEFNQFHAVAEEAVERLGLEGILQVASFHPQFQFAGTDADDITNATNRSPHPTLHLLREESISRAVAAFPDPSTIYEANILTLRALGHGGWEALRKKCHDDAQGTG
jgi:hypothetical protein